MKKRASFTVKLYVENEFADSLVKSISCILKPTTASIKGKPSGMGFVTIFISNVKKEDEKNVRKFLQTAETILKDPAEAILKDRY